MGLSASRNFSSSDYVAWFIKLKQRQQQQQQQEGQPKEAAVRVPGHLQNLSYSQQVYAVDVGQPKLSQLKQAVEKGLIELLP